jgi:hypothetical protein
MNSLKKFLIVTILGLALAACAGGPESKDFSAFRAAQPRSIVVVPVLNHSEEAEAADLFLTTLAVPLAERGYYVFPTNMVRGLMETDGLNDPMLVHSADTGRIGSLFGADTVLYLEILSWKVGYAVLATNITVEFLYTLKDGRSGELLWQEQEKYVHDMSAGSGNIFVDLIATAITAVATNVRADYTNVAVMANSRALLTPGQGIPFGPYSPIFGEDLKEFPSTGSGRLTNATERAVATGNANPNPDQERQ